MKWLAEKPSFVRYHLCVTMRKQRAWVCRATSAMRFWAISCWASAQNGSTSEVRQLVCTGNFFFIHHCSMFNAVPVSDLLPPSCALCKKKKPNKHTARCDSARSIEFPGSALGTSRPFVTHRSHFCGPTLLTGLCYTTGLKKKKKIPTSLVKMFVGVCSQHVKLFDLHKGAA